MLRILLLLLLYLRSFAQLLVEYTTHICEHCNLPSFFMVPLY